MTDNGITVLQRADKAVRSAQRGLLLAIVFVVGMAALTVSQWLRLGIVREELAAERDRNPCALVAMTMGGVAIAVRQAPDDLTRHRVAGAAAMVLHPVVSKCSGTDTSALAQRFTEGRTLDEQLAALDELRALVQP